MLIAPKRQQNSYDHRLRELVFQSGRTEIAKRIGVPRSTIHGWTKARPRPVVSLTAEGDYVESLEKKVYLLERRAARLRALLRFSGFALAYHRLQRGAIKRISFASLIVQADSFDCLDYLPASESLLRDTTIGGTRKSVDWMMSRLVPNLRQGK